MSAFLVADIQINDRETYEEYAAKAKPIVEQYGGKYIVSTEKVVPLGMEWRPRKILIIEFESSDRIGEMFRSPEYMEIAPLREKSSVSRSVIAQKVD